MLELLHGPDRTANSMELLARICENAAHGVAGQILIVPEQYSHETERALCERGGDTISRYAEVLSFTRLASRVFSVCGGVCEEYLDENGRILTLYLAAQQVREQLTVIEEQLSGLSEEEARKTTLAADKAWCDVQLRVAKAA